MAQDNGRTTNKKVLYMVIGILLALIIGFVCIFVIDWGMSDEKKADILANETFLDGVKIQGVDVSGMSFTEAEVIMKEKARTVLEDTYARFRVGDTTYRLSGGQLGAQVNYRSTMEEAMLFGRKGSILTKNKEQKLVEEQGVAFELELALDDQVLESSIQELSVQFNTTVQDAEILFNSKEINDEETMTLDSSLVITDDVIGRDVDIAALKEDILEAVISGKNRRVITAKWDETKPSITKEELVEKTSLMGSYTTYFKDSSSGRIYNIWKMAGYVDGVILQPGESWSINEAAGDRTTQNGWADAAGIVNGAYVEEPGGGICQVSTTLYIALLNAEVEIVDRTHHSWPLSYAPVGLDATISTGGPDFVFKNNYDVPIYIIAKVDGSGEKNITVEVYGVYKDYTIEFESETTKNEEPAEEPTKVVDNTMKSGESVWTKPRKNKVEANIWKIKKSKETGEQIGEKELFSTETYKAFRGEQTVGPEEKDEGGEDSEDGNGNDTDGAAGTDGGGAGQE